MKCPVAVAPVMHRRSSGWLMSWMSSQTAQIWSYYIDLYMYIYIYYTNLTEIKEDTLDTLPFFGGTFHDLWINPLSPTKAINIAAHPARPSFSNHQGHRQRDASPDPLFCPRPKKKNKNHLQHKVLHPKPSLVDWYLRWPSAIRWAFWCKDSRLRPIQGKNMANLRVTQGVIGNQNMLTCRKHLLNYRV